MTTPEPAIRLAYDVLGTPEPAPRARGRRLAVALVGAGALAVAGSAAAFATYLSGGGAQPEDVLPADAIAMVKLDLDPSAGQKIAVYRLAKRFPSTADQVQDQDRLKDQLLAAVLEGVDDVDYETDLQPWIGDRVGAALLPGRDEPEPLVAVAVTDRSAAEAALAEARALDPQLFYAFSEQADYVLLGASQAVVERAAGTADVLADTAAWAEGMDALDGDQIVTAWGDLGRLWAALPPEAREEAATMYGLEADVAVEGTVVAGLHAADDHVELVGKAVDISSPLQLESAIGGGRGSGLAQGLPADTVAALSVTNLGSGLAELLDSVYDEQDPLGILAGARELGVTLPDDLRTLLGEEVVLGAFGQADFAVRSRTSDAAAAYAKAQTLPGLVTGGLDASTLLRQVEGGIAVGTTPAALDAISSDTGGLGSSDGFRAAVPDADDAGYVLYVDIARALKLSGEDVGAGAQDVAQLRSFGVSGTGDSRNSTFRMRLTLQP